MPDKIVNGIKLNYEILGSGNAVVFVHGFMGSGQAWNHQTGWFAKKYKVIAPDMRGHGKTERPLRAEDYSVEILSSDLYHLLKTQKINRCCMIGHSWGARITAQFAINHHEMLTGIVLISNSGETPKEVLPVESWEKMSTMMREQGSVSSLLNVVETDPLTATFYNYQHDKKGKMLDKLNGRNATTYAHAWESFTNASSVVSELQSINLPVLLISGEKDLPNTIEIAKKVHESIPGSRYVLVKGVGHFPQDDAPDIVNHEISGFLSSLAW